MMVTPSARRSRVISSRRSASRASVRPSARPSRSAARRGRARAGSRPSADRRCAASRPGSDGLCSKADARGELAEPLALLRRGRRAPRAAVLDAEEDVVEHRHGGREGELLVDQRDPVADRVARRAKAHRLGRRRRISPSSGATAPATILPERRLAGAVLADERVDLACCDRDADVLERPGAAVVLADTPYLDPQAARRRRPRWSRRLTRRDRSPQPLVEPVSALTTRA